MTKLKTANQIKYGALTSYFALGLNIVIGVAFTPWMISSIGKGNYGLFTLAMSVISLFVFDFGLSNAVIRFISKFLAESKTDMVDKCIGLIFKLYLLLDVFLSVILCALYFVLPLIYKELTPAEIESFKVIYVIVSLFSIVSFPFIPINGVLSAYECFVPLKLCDIFHKIVMVGLMTVCLLCGYGLIALVLVNVFSGVLTTIAKLWCMKKYTTAKCVFNNNDKQLLKEIVSFSGWTTLSALAQRMIFTIAPTILGYYCGSASIAIFGIANVIEGYVYTFANALNGMFLPKISRIVSSEDGNVLPLMIKVGRIQLYIIGAVVLGFIAIGSDFIYVWVGDEFKLSYLCTVIIIIPSLFHLPQEIGLQTIYAKDKVKDQAKVYIIMGITNLILGISLTAFFDVFGVCIAICISYIIRTIGLDVIFYKKLDIDIFEFFKHTYVKMGIPLLLVCIVAVALNILLPEFSWPYLFLKSIVFFMLFLIASYIISNKYEKELIRNFFKNK